MFCRKVFQHKSTAISRPWSVASERPTSQSCCVKGWRSQLTKGRVCSLGTTFNYPLLFSGTVVCWEDDELTMYWQDTMVTAAPVTMSFIYSAQPLNSSFNSVILFHSAFNWPCFTKYTFCYTVTHVCEAKPACSAYRISWTIIALKIQVHFILVVLTDLKKMFCGIRRLKIFHSIFITTLVSYEAWWVGEALQEPCGVSKYCASTQCYCLFIRTPKVANVKRHADETEFKLIAISPAVEHGIRAAVREFNITESMVPKSRKQENELHRVKKTKQSSQGNKEKGPQLRIQMKWKYVESFIDIAPYNPVHLIVQKLRYFDFLWQ